MLTFFYIYLKQEYEYLPLSTSFIHLSTNINWVSPLYQILFSSRNRNINKVQFSPWGAHSLVSNTQELSHEYFLRLPLPQGWRKKHKSQACKYNQVLWFKKKEKKKKAMLILLAIVEQKMCLVSEITILCYFKKNIMKQLGQWGVSPYRWYSCIRNKGTREKQAPISDQRRG